MVASSLQGKRVKMRLRDSDAASVSSSWPTEWTLVDMKVDVWTKLTFGRATPTAGGCVVQSLVLISVQCAILCVVRYTLPYRIAYDMVGYRLGCLPVYLPSTAEHLLSRSDDRKSTSR